MHRRSSYIVVFLKTITRPFKEYVASCYSMIYLKKRGEITTGYLHEIIKKIDSEDGASYYPRIVYFVNGTPLYFTSKLSKIKSSNIKAEYEVIYRYNGNSYTAEINSFEALFGEAIALILAFGIPVLVVLIGIIKSCWRWYIKF